MARAILHVNVTDFAAAVARRCDPALRRRPVIVAPDHPAAPVYDMSDEAFRQGVRKGMPLGRARRFCRDAAVIPIQPRLYRRAMAVLFSEARAWSPRIEVPDLAGHLFLDLSGCRRLLGPPRDVGLGLARAVARELGITPAWTVASNKLVAKAASRLVRPWGEEEVPAGAEARFLAPLPLALLPGLLPEEVALLKQFNLRRAGEVARLDPAHLHLLLGMRGATVHRLVRGVDHEPVAMAGQPRPAIRQRYRFAEPCNDAGAICRVLRRLAGEVAGELRARRLGARTLGLTVQRADQRETARQRHLRHRTADSDTMSQVFLALWRSLGIGRHGVDQVECRVTDLGPAPVQLALFPTAAGDKRRRLQAAEDRLRKRALPGLRRGSELALTGTAI